MVEVKRNGMSIFSGFKNKASIEAIFPCEIKYKETQVAL
jgi:hypothetical protein